MKRQILASVAVLAVGSGAAGKAAVKVAPAPVKIKPAAPVVAVKDTARPAVKPAAPVAATEDSARACPAPTLAGKVGLGLTLGGIRYDGEYGDNVNLYARGLLRWNPAEWWALRAAGGGSLMWETKSAGKSVIFDGALTAMFQPPIGKSRFRPYVATGFGFSSIMVSADTARLRANRATEEFREGMRIGYVPVELGIEYLFSEQVSLSVMLENYVWAFESDLWDGLRPRGTSASALDFDHRDEVQRAGIALTFYVDPAPDADRDGVKDRDDRCPLTAAGISVGANGCPLDGDKDGTPDFQDKCPGTPEGVNTGRDGCPLDSDKDGVADFQDKCPGTPAGVGINAAGCPVDSDKDGVADFQDKCPGTPAGVKTSAEGCPVDSDKDGVADFQDKCPGTLAGAAIDAAGCPVDSDKDGVADFQDKCPNTQKGLSVDASGCPADADKDGVTDSRDRCPNTAVGKEVDSTGCPIVKIESGARLTLDGIVFKKGKSEIDLVSRPVLERAAEAILKAPKAFVEISGFTDNEGGEKRNKDLSQKRADAVRVFLVSLGVPSAQLSSKGYGSAEPVADNATEDGRSRNRRIEFRVK